MRGIDGKRWGLMGCNRDSVEICLILSIYVGYCGIMWNQLESNMWTKWEIMGVYGNVMDFL